MTTYIPDDSTYYALDHGPSALALILIGLVILVVAWALVPKFFEMLWASIAANNVLDERRAAAAAASVDMNACTDAMRAGAKARLR